MLLSATTASKQPKDQFDFFPLTVDVEERMYAAGKIPGSFFRREGRPSEDAILTCRLIDRPLRPAFVKGLIKRARTKNIPIETAMEEWFHENELHFDNPDTEWPIVRKTWVDWMKNNRGQLKKFLSIV